MRRFVAAAVLAVFLVPATGASAGRVPVTEDRLDGTKRVISLAAEKPRKRYRLRIVFADNRQKVVRWMHSGDTVRIEVGNRPHSLEIRCIPKKKKRR